MPHLKTSSRSCVRCFSSTSRVSKYIPPPTPHAYGLQSHLVQSDQNHIPVDYSKLPKPATPPPAWTPTSPRPTASQLAQSEARARAWYLPTAPPPPPKKKSIFTTFDPSRTSSILPSEIILKPLPANTPDNLKPLHRFLTEECADVLDVGSVVFLHTPSASAGNVGLGDTIKYEGDSGRQTGGRWEWVVSAEVKGVGKGVVGRADRYIRLWLHRNPLYRHSDSVVRYNSEGRPKLPRINEETDWTMIPVQEGGLCVNLFTADGRERWDLEGLYGAQSETGRSLWKGEDVRGLA